MPARRRLRAGSALLLLAGSLLVPIKVATGAGTGGDPEADQHALDQQRAQLKRKYTEVDSQMADLLATYDESTAAKAALDARVAELDTRIASTTADLQTAETALAAADADVRAGEVEIAAAEEKEAAAVVRLRSQALASYMGEGPLAMISDAVPRADVDLTVAFHYARLVSEVERRRVDEFTSRRAALASVQQQLAVARAAADARRADVASARADLERQRAEQSTLQEQAVQKVAEQQQLVQQLQARKASYQSQLDELQRESAAIATLLRQRAAAPTTTVTTTAKPKATTTAKPKPATTTTPGTPTSKPVPTSKPATTTTRLPTTIAPPAGAPAFSWPIAGAPVVSGFGMRVQPITGVYQLHAGVDIWAPEGTPIHAAAAGTVVSVGVHHGYGNAVIIDHGGGWATVYAHQSQTAAAEGQHVNAGDVIGYVGHTGLAAGPHLHFEIRVNGNPVDPLHYVSPH